MFRAKTDREKSDGEEEGEGGIGADKRLYYDRGVELSRDTGAIWPKKQSIERERYRVEETLCRFLEKIGHADIYIYIVRTGCKGSIHKIECKIEFEIRSMENWKNFLRFKV